MMPLLLKMHYRVVLEAGPAKTLMAIGQFRHSTSNSFMLRMSCIVKPLHFVLSLQILTVSLHQRIV